MANPAYPLQALLGQRERAKEEAEKAFAAALQAAQAAKERLAELHAERAALEGERREREAHLYDPGEDGRLAVSRIDERRAGIANVAERIEAKGREIAAQEEVIRVAEAAAEERKSALVAADRELKAIEKHREKWLAEIKKEAERKEQRLSEEISLAQFVRETAEKGASDDESTS